MELKPSLLAIALPFACVACDPPETSTSPGDSDRAKPLESIRALRPPPSVPVAKPGGSAPQPATSKAPESADSGGREAEAEFTSVPKMKLTGDAELDETIDGVHIVLEVEGAPAGLKAVHIHEKGDCSDIAGNSMGRHFAPQASEHGMPYDREHHLGDLGNIDINEDGDGTLRITVPKANLKPGDAMSLIGKSIAIHESKDTGDGESGNAGKAIACALIKAD